MGSNYQRGGALSPDTVGIPIGLTDEERALWEYMGPFEATKTAILIDAGSRRFYNNINRDVDPMIQAEPGPYWLLDRCGDRIFSPAAIFVTPNTFYRRPLVVRHPTTGRLRLLFGIGGGGSFTMTSALAGTLKNNTDVKEGVETNALPLIVPGLGFTLFAKLQTGIPSTTETITIVKLVDDVEVDEDVSITWPANTGGVYFGGGSTVAITDCLRADLQNSTGSLRVLTQSGGGSNDTIENTADHRDNIVHTVISTWSGPGTHIRKLWVDEIASTPKSAVSLDVGNSAGANRPIIGGIGDIGPPPLGTGPTNGYVGYLDCLGFWQGDTGDSDAARTAIWEFMATRGGP